jgi:hypothetical protein
MNQSINNKFDMTFQSLIQTAPHLVKRKLEQLKFLRERPDFHPEPSAFHHIQIVTERVQVTGNPNLIFAGILHDICKLDTVKMNEKTGWPTSPGHDDAAHDLILNNEDIQTWIRSNGGTVVHVMNLCKFHMRFHQLGEMRESKRNANIENWKALGIWDDLQILGAADNMLEDFDINNIQKSYKWNREKC